MIRFLDGAAKGTVLSLRRVPWFLRVVIDEAGQVDALDQLDDQAREGETLYVYRQAGQASRAILCSRGRGCRTEISCDYSLWPDQPPQEVLRDNDQWREWAEARGKEIEAGGAAGGDGACSADPASASAPKPLTPNP